MKNFIKGVLAFGMIAMFACEGPMGPPGSPGLPGADGVTIVGQVFETDFINFNSNNNFSTGFRDFPYTIEETDKVLVYALWRIEDNVDVWRLLPQMNIEFSELGIFFYNYEFTMFDYNIFMEGNFNLSQLPSEYRDNQIFRVVILPVDPMGANARIDYSDFDGVMKLLDKTEEDIIKLN
ncbi:hypothetical protein ACFOUP_01955 [Belliella kenyensis]|uniref:Collagen-like protein n=1 Tax=Belliella kenyensis TaxID=1472724 RepID=A0ABV8EIR1_9BACT|nr:hypothetical protein [Belliella kenyensis]MCH7401041.1 hypothetical protein [Belliella kenyensis]MDN3604039.1 hypothetical protein [Belliella kenyensis]